MTLSINKDRFVNLCYTGCRLIIQQNYQLIRLFDRMRLGQGFDNCEVAQVSWKSIPSFSSQDRWAIHQDPSIVACWKSDQKILRLNYNTNGDLEAFIDEPGKTTCHILPNKLYIQQYQIFQDLIPYVENQEREYSLYLVQSIEKEGMIVYYKQPPQAPQETVIPNDLIQALQHSLQTYHAGHNYSPDWATRFFQCCQAVCRIVTPNSTGTGFVIGNRLVMTNHHVLKDPETCRNSRAQFFYDLPNSETVTVEFDPDTFFERSENPGVNSETQQANPLIGDKLDFTIVALKCNAQLEEIFARPILLNQMERDGIGAGKGFVLIHHPVGKEKKTCLPVDLNNRIMRVAPLYFVHTAFVDPGSSGAPVLSTSLRLIGLHRQIIAENSLEKAAIKVETIRSFLEKNQSTKYPSRTCWDIISKDFQPKQFPAITMPLQEQSIDPILKILKETYQRDPLIPQFSGESLTLKSGYFNLQDIANKTVSPEKIFQRQKGEKRDNPLYRLILGEANVGESTFCKQITYEWAKGDLWNDLFRWIFFIPVIKFKDKKYRNIKDFIGHEFFEYLIRDDLFETFWKKEMVRSYNVLLLLDGFQFPFDRSHLKLLTNCDFFHILITSNIFFDEIQELSEYKQFKLSGFSTEDIKKYANDCFKNQSEGKQKRIVHLLTEDPIVSSITSIPVLLDMFCGFFKSQESFKLDSISRTTLYFSLEKFLLKHLSVSDKVEQDLINFLSRLAFSLMNPTNLSDNKTQTIFKEDQINHAFLQQAITIRVIKQLENTNNYVFVHMSFQEYYAARYLTLLLKNSQKQAEAKEFIKANKYDQRMKSLFMFAAGLCLCLEEKNSNSSSSANQSLHLVDQLFESLLPTPDEIVFPNEFYDFELAIGLLEESRLSKADNSEKFQAKVKSEWIIPPFYNPEQKEKHAFYRIASFLRSSPYCIQMICIPKYLELVNKGNPENIVRVCKALSTLAVINQEITDGLLRFIQNSNRPPQEIKTTIFQFLIQIKQLEGMNQLNFEKVCSLYPSEKFIEQSEKLLEQKGLARLDLLHFLNICFKHQNFTDSCLKIIIGFAEKEGYSLTLNSTEKKIVLSKNGSLSFPYEGDWESLTKLKEEKDKLSRARESQQFNQEKPSTFDFSSIVAIFQGFLDNLQSSSPPLRTEKKN